MKKYYKGITPERRKVAYAPLEASSRRDREPGGEACHQFCRKRRDMRGAVRSVPIDLGPLLMFAMVAAIANSADRSVLGMGVGRNID